MRSYYDSCLYYKGHKVEEMVIILIYVDDMLLVGSSKKKIERLKFQLSSEFEMKDLGHAQKILGMCIIQERGRNRLKVSQTSYIEKMVSKFSMEDSKPIKILLAGHFKFSSDQCPSSDEEKKDIEKVPYSSAVGSVMFTMVSTRPDISHAISVLSRFMSNPENEHWLGMKWLLRYLKGSSDVGLIYEKRGNSIWLEGYSNSDYGADRDKRRLITSYFFNLNGCCISWKAQLQPVVALSITEAEYIAATKAIKEAL
ncbi:hypothetical protein UlMin_029670 [Ulmus minor]